MRIPESWLDKHGEMTPFWSRVEPSYVEKAIIGKNKVTVLYETPSAGCGYGCSPSDVLYLLDKIAIDGMALPDLVLFRQPTRNQMQQSPVWGRFIYFADVGKYSGTAIILEAQKFGVEMFWKRKLCLADQAEFKRLQTDGHEFVSSKRGHVATLQEDTVRSTILYRTLIHELGHFIQFHSEMIDEKTMISADPDVAQELHFAKPASELEAFAHRFADETSKRLRQQKIIPFDPKPFTVKSKE